jgi:YbbR domain-containing protein
MRFTRTLLSNVTTLLLAILLAIVIWATAVRADDPVETRTFEIPVDIVGMAADAEVTGGQTQSVLITIEGPNSALAQALPNDFRGLIDLSETPYGEVEVPIQVQGDFEQVELVSVFPESTQLRLNQIITRDIPVVIQIRGEVPRGHRLGNERVEPDVVQVTGPADRVGQLAEGRVVIFVDDAREDITEMRRPNFYDLEGNLVSTSGLTISPQEVETIVPVTQLAGFAEKPVSALWVGEPASGYRLLDVRVEPSSVQVTGTPDQLDTLFVQTEPLDITGLTESVTQQVTLDLPEGITPIDLQPVFVTVEIVPIQTSAVVQRPVEVRALEEGLEAEVDPEEVRVFMFGPLPVLESLADDDIRVTVDVLGLITGTHVLEPLVTVSASEVEVRSTQPAQVTVVITGVVTPTETTTPTATLLPDGLMRDSLASEGSGLSQYSIFLGSSFVADLAWSPFDQARGRKEKAT